MYAFKVNNNTSKQNKIKLTIIFSNIKKTNTFTFINNTIFI